MTTQEGTFKLTDGQVLYTKTWLTESDSPSAEIVFIHGFSDHCNAGYEPFFKLLNARNIRVFSFDQRGWGKTNPDKPQWGLTGPTSLVLSDINEVLLARLSQNSGVPVFLMGHSMGGGEILAFAGLGPKETISQLSGFIAESPFIAVSPESRPSVVTVFVGRLASKVLPHRPLYVGLDPATISRDPAVVKAYIDDPLTHDTGTLEGLAGMLDRAADLYSHKIRLPANIKLLLAHGTEDKITYYPASKEWFEKSEITDKQFASYEGWYHKLHAEPGDDKKKFADDVADWCLARLGRDSKL